MEHPMKLHKDSNAFIEFIQKTSEDLGIQDIFVEKDYWVTYILKTLSLWDTQKTVVFKGGTSLSKAYSLIDRFSEDVDLVLKDTRMNQNQIKRKLREVHNNVGVDPLREVDTSRTLKGSRFRKVDYSYPQILDDYKEIGDASDKLLVELNSFGNPFPVVERPIRTYIAEMLEQENKLNLISQYGLESFSVEVLDFKRTFSEKILGLLRVSLKKDIFLDELRARVRHFYDITKLLSADEIKSYLASEDFIKYSKEIYKNDMNTPEFRSDWISTDLSENPLFVKTDEILAHVESHFNSQFKSLLYTREKFDFKEIKPTIEVIKIRLSKIIL
tara:strand:+ start:1846 stop:2832 length:987 start_codon:yes stop_codon:yes gene_type:complete